MDTQTIGQIIKKTWQESGLSQKEFADMMNMSVRNLQYLFERPEIHMKTIARASAVLKKDFISIYLNLPKDDDDPYDYTNIYHPNSFANEPQTIYTPQKKSNEITVQLSIKGDFTIVSKYFPEIVSKIKREAESYGLTIA